MLLNNRFRILKQLAKGGFGATYLAEDTHMLSRRHCVVKQLQPEVPDQNCYGIALKKFKEEAAVLEKLKHDQIPQLYGYFEQEGRLFLIQEWVDGPTVGEKVRALGQLSGEEVQQMLLQILPVLDYLHHFKVIHRDIKPDNLILRQVDSRPVLIDFGSMKQHLKTRISFSGSVVDSVIIGTEGFMAPEQAAQRTVYASDIYSLGMTAIYALTAKLPVEMESDYDTGQFRWRQYAPQVSDHLADILNKATEFSPQDRFSTASEMLDALTLQNMNSAAILMAERSVHDRPTILDPVEPEGPAVASATSSTRHWLEKLECSPSRVMTSLLAGGIGFAIALSSQSLTPRVVEANPDQNQDTGKSLVQAANTFSGQGKVLGAIRTLLNVPTHSQYAEESRQKVANLIHLELGQLIDQELDILNLEKPPGKAKRSLAGIGVSYLSEVDTKTQTDRIQTRLGYSKIKTYRSNWPIHRQPTDADLAADAESWYDPWMEQYDIAPGISMEVMYGCMSNKILQTAETFNRGNADSALIEARFNRILQGSRPEDIQVSLATLKQLIDNPGKARTESFSTDQVRGWIISHQDQIMIVTRKI